MPKRPVNSSETSRLDRVVADARREAERRMTGYREQSLRLHPWICGRCGREFTRANLHELTVHHKDHNHENNPPDGSNWENLCLYCHDNEHQRHIDNVRGREGFASPLQRSATFNPFADLADRMKRRNDEGG